MQIARRPDSHMDQELNRNKKTDKDIDKLAKDKQRKICRQVRKMDKQVNTEDGQVWRQIGREISPLCVSNQDKWFQEFPILETDLPYFLPSINEDWTKAAGENMGKLWKIASNRQSIQQVISPWNAFRKNHVFNTRFH